MPLREPTGRSREELLIKRSRFICEARKIDDGRHARRLIAEKREEHPKAAHVVYAFSHGDEKNRQFGMSDDGEPRNSAGRPVLELLRGSNITNVVVTIVRYFGGTKLGTGGLVHAYSDGAKLALQKLPTRELVDEAVGTVEVSYPLLDGAKKILYESGARILTEDYGEAVQIRLGVRREAQQSVEKALRDVSSGSLEVNWD